MDETHTPLEPAGFMLEESLTSSRDDWHEVGFHGHHPLAGLFRDANTSTVTIVDKHGDERTYRRPKPLRLAEVTSIVWPKS